MKEDRKIGLALSGGGMRAAVFHLGVLKYLAQQHELDHVAYISTVSGASICMELIFGCNHNKWPSDEEFLDKVLPTIQQDITSIDIQWTALIKWLINPYYWDKKVNLLGNVMEKKWHITGCLQDLPSTPVWIINTTCYETGKDFRIMKKRMGNINQSHVSYPTMRISHASAASAGFPIWIGPYKLKAQDYVWYETSDTIMVKQKDSIIHLWDGGVYDNMGLDPLVSMQGEDSLKHDLACLIVSNASSSIKHQTRTMSYSIQNLKRLLEISRSQVEQIKSRNVMDMFAKLHNGIYLKIGSTAKEILKNSSMNANNKQKIIASSLSEEEVEMVQNYKTSLASVNSKDFDKILRHGYETIATSVLKNKY